MREILADLVRKGGSALEGRNIAREYLQARILGSMQRAGAMLPLAFQGGTALRFLYGLPRYSEDLDFAVERQPDAYDFRRYLTSVRTELEREGYDLRLKANDNKAVHAAFIGFPGLPHELGLSAHKAESLAVKIEVDTAPPKGATLETTVVRRHVTLHLQHHDRSSLLAGKLNDFLTRPYTKGRDVYDLLWYFADPSWPAPNLVLLDSALRQHGWTGPKVTAANWKGVLLDRLEGASWDAIVRDVEPFLEREGEAGLLSADDARKLLGGDR